MILYSLSYVLLEHLNSKIDDLEMTLRLFLPGEVALEELVVVNGLGNHPADKLEVVEVVGVGLRLLIDGVSDLVAWRHLEQGVHGVENLPGDDDVPLPKKSARVLTLLPLEHNVEPGTPQRHEVFL